MKTNLLRHILPFVALGFVAAGTASAQTAIPGGTHSAAYVISKPGSYYLAANRVMTKGSESIIEINAPDVTIDLRGHTLSFAAGTTGSGHGIQADMAINVEIRNGSIQDTPAQAVYASQNGGAVLRLVDLRIAGTNGIYSNTRNTTIERCQIIDTKQGSAIRFDQAGGVVRHCTISNVLNGSGVDVTAGSTVAENVISDTSLSGIYMSASGPRGGIVSENNISNANLSGHQWHGGVRISINGVMVSRNSIAGAKSSGIRFETVWGVADGNVVCATLAGLNGATGVGIQTFTTATVLRNNTGAGNAGGFLAGAATDGGGNVTN